MRIRPIFCAGLLLLCCTSGCSKVEHNSTLDAVIQQTEAVATATKSVTSVSTASETAQTTVTVKQTETADIPTTDDVPPIVLNQGGGYLLTGDAFDINDYVGFGDDYDDKPKLSYTGTVDVNTPGAYTLTATAEDASGNTTSWELTVTVVDEIPEEPDNAPRIAFDDFAAQYGGAGKSLGIDVSKWQGDIDFQAVKDAGCSFVIMRIGSDYDEIVMDSTYQQNMAAAKAAGLQVGVYFYSTGNSEEKIRAEANWIAAQLDGQPLDFPVAFDWESFSNYQKYEMSIHKLNQLYEIFREELAAQGYDTMLYSSKNFLYNFWYGHEDSPTWLAHYTDETDYTGDYAIWQMSSRGRIDGIAGDVDLNILYMDKLS